MKGKLLIIRNAHEITLASYSLALRDDCMDAEGRATHGAVAERVGVRGYNSQVISCMLLNKIKDIGWLVLRIFRVT
jgi:hypothetical protein